MYARMRAAFIRREIAGTGRSPFRLDVMRLRKSCLAVVLVVALGYTPTARATPKCTPLGGDISWAEWSEGSKPRGAKLVFGAQWQEARTMHGQWLAYQSTSGDISGFLRFGLPQFQNLISEDDRAALGLSTRLKDRDCS